MTYEDHIASEHKKSLPLTPLEAGFFLLAVLCFAFVTTLQGFGMAIGLMSLLAGWIAALRGERKPDRITWSVIATVVALLVLLVVLTPASGTAGA